MKVLIVDNRDSFTYNLVDYVTRFTGLSPDVVTHDVPAAQVAWANYDAVIISPGPGHPANPADLGLSAWVVDNYRGPLLGVCLGMQAMVQRGGGRVERAPAPVHGRASAIKHDGTGLFAQIDSPDSFVRYHSLAVAEMPQHLRVTATVAPGEPDAGLVMGCEDVERPRWGVQFHPESLLSHSGLKLMENFLDLAARYHREREYFCVRTFAAPADAPTLAHLLTGTNVFWIDSGDFTILGDDSGPSARHITYRLPPEGGGNADKTAASAGKTAARSGETAASAGDASAADDFFAQWDADFRAHRLPRGINPPIPGCDFALGWVGYLGYELGQLCGAAPMPPLTQPAPSGDPDGARPDAEFIFVDRAIVIDRRRGCTHLLSFAGDDAWGEDITQVVADGPACEQGSKPQVSGPISLAMDASTYLARIARAQEYIAAGETYEVCLTNRLGLRGIGKPLEVFEYLRRRHPSARTGYLGFAGQQLISTSPELFLAVDSDGLVTSKPIKGTRARDRNASAATQDAVANELRTNPKDRAENLMIVDLVRNDLSRVCDGVSVPVFGEVEAYATVFQLVSTVTGHLRREHTPVDAIRATFPGGSMTGAPKHRTMQIISELEGIGRGVYSGAFGYLSVTGTADFSMVIRSIINHPDGAYYGVGGAILHVSEPAAELAETQVKARVLTELVGEDPWE